MDQMLEALTDFVEATDLTKIGPSTLHRVARHTVDAVGCGAGGFFSAPAAVARSMASGSRGDLEASVYGLSEPAPIDLAAFANVTANRYLDFNDFGVSGHPSDMIPAMLAMGEANGSSGSDVVVSIYLAYEIATRMAEAVPADLGWDQGIYCSVGVAAGLSKLLGLPRGQMANAVSLAVVPAIPLRVTRFGELSEWKAAATGHAAMTACFATRLASRGMTGPPAPFEGKDGLFERIWPAFDLNPSAASHRGIERASLKQFPACYWGQVPVALMMELRERADISRVERIEVATCERAWWTIGGGRGDADEKWRPPTRETADHSMPYLLALALIDGVVDESGFELQRLCDPVLMAVMDNIRVRERADLTARATRDTCPTELTIQLKNGAILTASSDVPRGHHENPMDDHEVTSKFQELVKRALPAAIVTELADALWHLAELPSLHDVGAMFRMFAPQ